MHELYALNLLDGWGDDWWRAASIATVLNNRMVELAAAIAAANGISLKQDDHWMEVDDLIPQFREPETKPGQMQMGTRQAERFLKGLAGY